MRLFIEILDDEMIFISNLTESGMKIPEGEQTEAT